MKVILTSQERYGILKDYEPVFEKNGVELLRCEVNDYDAMAELSKGAQVLMVYDGQINKAVIDRLDSSIKCILSMYVGFDNIDVKAATARGIMVCNNPDYGMEEVAAMAITLMLACNRKIKLYDLKMQQGIWDVEHLFEPYGSRRLSTMTLGVMGFGKIARCAARMGLGLGMRVVAYDPYIPQEVFAQNGVEKAELDELYAQADAITIHIPLMDSTRHMVDAEAFSKMKDHVILVNTARGPLVHTPSLIEALKSGKVAAAGLDVFDTEPLEPNHELHQFENVILTPHIAYCTLESTADVDRLATELAICAAKGEVPYSCVNKRELGLQK